MSALSRILVTIGLLSLFHAAYSAHEHSTTVALARSHLSPSSTTTSSLPLDIKLETLFSLLISCFGLVLGAESLRPISWSSWAGKIEREGGGMNPFGMLEDRIGFMDIRAKRKEFTDWVKQGGIEDVKS